MTQTFFELKNNFFEKKQTKVKFDLFKKFEMNKFLAILKLCPFYNEYKKEKLMGN